MSEEQRNRQQAEKQEKHEKEEEKKGEKEEKNWEEKWRRDPLNAAAWAIILIWAGVVLLANNLGLLDWIPLLEPWSVFFLGAGTILLLEIAIRLLLPAYRQPVLGTIILAIVFLAIGLGGLQFIGWQCIWPAVIIALGLYLLYRGLFQRRQQ